MSRGKTKSGFFQKSNKYILTRDTSQTNKQKICKLKKMKNYIQIITKDLALLVLDKGQNNC